MAHKLLPSYWTRGNGQKLMHRKSHQNARKNFFTVNHFFTGDHELEEVVQTGCGVSLIENIQEPFGHNLEPCALG